MKDAHVGALLEDIDNKFDIILESLDLMATSAQLKAVDERLIRVEDDVKIIRKVVTATNRDLQDHEHRISALEGV